MSGLLSIGVSSLNAFQTALSTVSQNITNSETEGYSRQSVQIHSMGESGQISAGGVFAGDPTRNYNDFLRNQINSAESRYEGADKYLTLANRLTSLMGATDTGVVKSLDDMFTAAGDLRNNPGSATSKSDYLGKATSLTTQARTLASSLDDIRTQVNEELESYVDAMNNGLKRLATVNEAIVTVGSQQGGSVNGLYDTRDRMIKELNQYIDVDATVNADGTVELYTQSGFTLLNANQPSSFSVNAGTSLGGVANYEVTMATPTDPNKVVSDQMQGGMIGSMLAFREDMLEPSERKLANAVLSLAEMINAQQKAGYTYDTYVSDPTQKKVGQNMFEPMDLTYQTGGSTIDIGFTATASSHNIFTNTPMTAGEVTNQANSLGLTSPAKYELTSDGVNFTISNLSTGNSGTSTGFGAFSFEGLTFDVSTMSSGDQIQLDPYTDAMRDFSLVSGFSADNIAVSSSSSVTDSANSANIEYIEDLKDLDFMNGGKDSPRTVMLENASTVGAQTNTAALNVEAYELSLNQLEESAAAVSSVNLDTELATLLQYQQAYQAAGKIVETSNTIFDTLLRAL